MRAPTLSRERELRASRISAVDSGRLHEPVRRDEQDRGDGIGRDLERVAHFGCVVLHERGDRRAVLAALSRGAFPHGRVAILVETEFEVQRPQLLICGQRLEPRCRGFAVVDIAVDLELFGEDVEYLSVDGVGNREEKVLFVREVFVDRASGVARRVRDLVE